MGSGAVFEAPALVACLDDFTVMGEAIEQCSGHLGVTEDARPFAEGEIGGDDDGRALVQTADQVEQELAAGLGEREIAQFVQNDEVEAGALFRRVVASLGVQSRRTPKNALK